MAPALRSLGGGGVPLSLPPDLPEDAARLVRMLRSGHAGAGLAVSGEELARRLGFLSDREGRPRSPKVATRMVQELVKGLRQAKVPVGSTTKSGGGYFWPLDWDEYLVYVNAQHRRYESNREAYEEALACLPMERRQGSLFAEPASA